MRTKHPTLYILITLFFLFLSVLSIPVFLLTEIFAEWTKGALCTLSILSILYCTYRIYHLRKRTGRFRKGVYLAEDFDSIDGIDFEQIVCDILVANDFESAENTPASSDYGVDILATRGGITYAIQCKRYNAPVGLEAVQQVYAGRAFYECHVALVLTNQTFTKNARELADKLGVVLWDRNDLKRLL